MSEIDNQVLKEHIEVLENCLNFHGSYIAYPYEEASLHAIKRWPAHCYYLLT